MDLSHGRGVEGQVIGSGLVQSSVEGFLEYSQSVLRVLYAGVEGLLLATVMQARFGQTFTDSRNLLIDLFNGLALHWK